MSRVWILVLALTALAGAAVGQSGAGSASCNALSVLRSIGGSAVTAGSSGLIDAIGNTITGLSSSAGSAALGNAVATAIAPDLQRAFTTLEAVQCSELANLLDVVVASVRLGVGRTLDDLSLFVNDDRVLGPLAPVLGAAIRVVRVSTGSVLTSFSAPAGVCDRDVDGQSSSGGILNALLPTPLRRLLLPALPLPALSISGSEQSTPPPMEVVTEAAPEGTSTASTTEEDTTYEDYGESTTEDYVESTTEQDYESTTEDYDYELTTSFISIGDINGDSTIGEILEQQVKIGCRCLSLLLYLTVQLLRALVEMLLEVGIARVSSLGLGAVGVALVGLQSTLQGVVHDALNTASEVFVPENVCGEI